MIGWILIFILFIVILVLFYKYSKIQGHIEKRAQEYFHSWRDSEQQYLDRWKEMELERRSGDIARTLFDSWKNKEEQNIRSDAIKRSQSVTRGRITECLVPFFPDFPYNPKDARFLGTPVDFIVFDGLSNAEDIHEVVFIEVKTGSSASLSGRERAVRNCINERRVRYETIHQFYDAADNQILDMKRK